jgi:hypothetical protein
LFTGLLSTSVVDSTAQLQGVLRSDTAGAVAIECSGPLQGIIAPLSCRTTPLPAAPRQ